MPTMLGELRRHFRDRGWIVRPPRTLGHAPNVGQLAEHTGLSLEEVLEAREASAAHSATSLSAPADPDGDGELGDTLGHADLGFGHAEDRATVASLMRTLTPREREILRLRLEDDLTQSEIGQRVGLSQMHVSRLLRQILDKLHHAARQPTAAQAAPTFQWLG